MDAAGRFIAIILAVILIILFPLQYIAQSQGEVIDDTVHSHVNEFTDTARYQGFITLDMYEEFVEKLSISGELYDVDIEAAHPVSGKELAAKTLGDDIGELQTRHTSFVGLEKDTEKASSNDSIQSFAAHTHTADCYGGHLHTSYCYKDPVKITYSYDDDSYSRRTTYTSLSIRCGYCDDELYRISHMQYWYQSTYDLDYIQVYDLSKSTSPIFTVKKNAYNTYSSVFATYEDQYRSLRQSVNQYLVLSNHSNDSNGDSYSYYIGTVPVGQFTYDIPYIGKYKPHLDCVNHTFILTGTNDNSSYNIKIKCMDCGNLIIEYYRSNYDGYFNIVLYKNGRYDKNYNTYSNLQEANSFSAGIMSLYQSLPQRYPRTTYLKMDDSRLNYSILSPYINHGCDLKRDYNCGLEEAHSHGSASQVHESFLNCYAPELYVTEDPASHGKTFKCTVCNIDIYFMNNTGGYLQINNLVTRQFINISSTDPNYTTYQNDYNNIMSIYSKYRYYNGSYWVSKIPATKFRVNIPYFGVFQGCPACSDFKVHRLAQSWSDGSSSSDFSVQCLKCKQVVLRSSGDYTGFAFYKNGIFIEYISAPYNSANRTFLEGLLYIQPNPANYNYSTAGSYGGYYRNESITHVPYYHQAFNNSIFTPYLNHGCNYGQSIYCGLTDTPPLCNQIVTSITATNPIQTVNRGQGIITTATATYLDGHTEIVNCSSNYNANAIGTQTVTLTYSGLVGNAKTTGTRICTMQVTMKEPYKLISITAAPSIQSISRYTNPSFSVTAFYDNNTSKIVTGYTVSGYNSSMIGAQTVTVTYLEGSITKTTTATVEVKYLSITCTICGAVYELDNQDTDKGCPSCNGVIVGIRAIPENIIISKGDALPITVEAIYRSGRKAAVDGWTNNFDPDITGLQEVTITYQGFCTYVMINVKENGKACPICGNLYSFNEDGTDPGCPICKEEVISIEATPEQQIIEKHQPLNLTVMATFRDGHTEEVTGWSTNLSPDKTGTFDVTVRYKNASVHIIVTILEEGIIQCPYCGLEYSYREHPDGCPVCYKTIIGIEAALRNGGTTVPYKASLNLQIVLIYRDTHRELTYTGWTADGFDSEVIGMQTITVHYKEFRTTLTIEVLDNPYRVICSNGHEYYLNNDGSDPGCPRCITDTTRDSAIFLFDTTYTNDILELLYRDGIFYFNKGDYLIVKVTRRGTTIRDNLQQMFFRSNKRELYRTYTYGGEVL